MRRFLLTALTLVTLLSQWGWLEHAYHEHDAGGFCGFCLSSASQHNHAITASSATQLPVIVNNFVATPLILSQPVLTNASFQIRAPPRFLL